MFLWILSQFWKFILHPILGWSLINTLISLTFHFRKGSLFLLLPPQEESTLLGSLRWSPHPLLPGSIRNRILEVEDWDTSPIVPVGPWEWEGLQSWRSPLQYLGGCFSWKIQPTSLFFSLLLNDIPLFDSRLSPWINFCFCFKMPLQDETLGLFGGFWWPGILFCPVGDLRECWWVLSPKVIVTQV